MDSCTENYECLVCDNKTSKENTIDACVFEYKAAIDLPEYRLGTSSPGSCTSFITRRNSLRSHGCPSSSPGAVGSVRAAGVRTVIKHDERGEEHVKTKKKKKGGRGLVFFWRLI